MAGIRTLGLSACVLKYFSKRPETMPPIVPLTMSGCPDVIGQPNHAPKTSASSRQCVQRRVANANGENRSFDENHTQHQWLSLIQ